MVKGSAKKKRQSASRVPTSAKKRSKQDAPRALVPLGQGGLRTPPVSPRGPRPSPAASLPSALPTFAPLPGSCPSCGVMKEKLEAMEAAVREMSDLRALADAKHDRFCADSARRDDISQQLVLSLKAENTALLAKISALQAEVACLSVERTKTPSARSPAPEPPLPIQAAPAPAQQLCEPQAPSQQQQQQEDPRTPPQQLQTPPRPRTTGRPVRHGALPPHTPSRTPRPAPRREPAAAPLPPVSAAPAPPSSAAPPAPPNPVAAGDAEGLGRLLRFYAEASALSAVPAAGAPEKYECACVNKEAGRGLQFTLELRGDGTVEYVPVSIQSDEPVPTFEAAIEFARPQLPVFLGQVLQELFA